MKISCPTCAAKYSVADEKIQSRLAKIRCRKCSSTIVIDGTASPASVYIGDGSSPLGTSAPPQEGAPEAAPVSARSAGPAIGGGFPERASEPVGPAADEYAVDIADNDQRNMTIHQIVGAYNEGLITADTYIWKEGMPDWQTLAEVPEVADALHAAARPMGAPAAVRRPGPATDLFGSIDTAGGENDITTSAPQPMMTAGTGARNESSVLFSLSALTSTPEPSSPSAAKRRATADDSGLIDLQALTSAEAAAGAGAFAAPVGAFGASPLISAPLGGVSGPAIGASLVSSYGRRSNRTSLVVAASVLAIGIIGAAFVVVKRGGNDESESTLALDQAAAAAPQHAAAAEPTKNESEEEPVAAAEEAAGREKEPTEKDSVAADDLPKAAEPEPVAKPRAVRAPAPKPSRAPVRARPQPAAASAPEPAPAATPKPAPAASSDGADAEKKKKAPARCVCAPSDLMCAMKCSAKR